MLSLVDIELVHRRAEYGRFLIGDEQAARGIPAAVEALGLLFDLAFDELGLERVYGYVVGTNRRMLKWQVYLGMREEARLRRHLWLGGHWHDAVMLGLLEPEYRGVTRNRMQALIAAGRPRQEAA
jgi:diamine N-acetyltransferase